MSAGDGRDAGSGAGAPAGGETGRWLVALGRLPTGEGVRALRALGVADVAVTSDGAGAGEGAGALLLEHLGVAVVDEPPDGPVDRRAHV